MDSLVRLARSTAKVYREYRDRFSSSLKHLVNVIWRETTPQNFNSTNGFYSDDIWNYGYPCVFLDKDRRVGSSNLMFPVGKKGSILSKCVPSCCSASKRNDLVLPLFKGIIGGNRSSMLVETVFEELASSHYDIHVNSSGDCTHLNINSLIFLNMHLISILDLLYTQ